jgi:hypothetical protein
VTSTRVGGKYGIVHRAIHLYTDYGKVSVVLFEYCTLYSKYVEHTVHCEPHLFIDIYYGDLFHVVVIARRLLSTDKPHYTLIEDIATRYLLSTLY